MVLLSNMVFWNWGYAIINHDLFSGPYQWILLKENFHCTPAVYVSNKTLRDCQSHCKIHNTPKLTFRTTTNGDPICGCCLDRSSISSAPGSDVYEFQSKGKSLFSFHANNIFIYYAEIHWINYNYKVQFNFPGNSILLNNERMPMIALHKTRLDLTNVGIHDAYYTDHLPKYLATKFPLYGTNRVGNITSSTLYLPYSTTAYLIRFVFMFEGFLSCLLQHPFLYQNS